MASLVGMSQPSVLYQLVEERLGGPGALAEYVAKHYANVGWRRMASDLTERTGLSVHRETLRLWFAGRITTTVVVADVPSGSAV